MSPKPPPPQAEPTLFRSLFSTISGTSELTYPWAAPSLTLRVPMLDDLPGVT